MKARPDIRLLRFLPVAVLLLVAAAVSPDGRPPLGESARWLQGYLRIDTTNPPGRERAAAEYLAAILQKEGIRARLLAGPGGRTSLWASLPATAPRPPGSPGSGGAVVLMHHMDVVVAGREWSVPPFAGLVRDGRLWGRGAVDCKSLGVAALAAMIDLHRRGTPRARDVVFLAVADEESGGRNGTAWLLEQHPELFRDVAAVLNEGGANRSVNGRMLWWGIEVAQKRPLWLELETNGRGGHGSGLNPHSAAHKLVAGLGRALDRPARYRVSAPARDYLAALAPLHSGRNRRIFADVDRVVTESGPTEPLLPGLANLFLDTFQVTVLDVGDKVNVIPGRARAEVDVRLLPDTDAEAYLADLRETVGPDVRVEVLLTSPPAEPSPTANPVYRAVEKVLAAEGDLAAPVVPSFIAGFTDSRWFRERGIPAYGISPFALEPDELRGIHGPDERIRLEELERGVERMRRILAAAVR